MNIDIVSRDFALTTAIEAHIRRKLAALVVWRIRDIDTVRVTLGDTNGPRGGIDKYCRTLVQLVGGRTIHVEQVSGDLYDAISRSIARTERAVVSALSRRRRHRRRGLEAMWG